MVARMIVVECWWWWWRQWVVVVAAATAIVTRPWTLRGLSLVSGEPSVFGERESPQALNPKPKTLNPNKP